MKSKNIFLVGLGYLAGLAVALKFSKDGKKKDLNTLTKEAKTIHKNLWNEAEKSFFSEEVQEKLTNLKVQALLEIKKFQKEAQPILLKLKKKGEWKIEEIEKALEKLYEERREILEMLFQEGKEHLSEAMEEWSDTAKKLEKKIQTVGKEVKKDLEKTYKTLRKKL